MRLLWKVSAVNAREVASFVEVFRDTPFVEDRVRRNLRPAKPRITRRRAWYVQLGCLLTTQQRSGPDSAVARFMRQRPFPLSYENCRLDGDLERRVFETLTRRGGIRRTKTIAEFAAGNLQRLEAGDWRELMSVLNGLRGATTVLGERRAADFVDDALRGFGPKQSRNMIQWLGLSRFETPLDSRITKWLNDFGFPVELNSQLLSDRSYYHFVEDGFQALCAKAGEYPCVVDAAIFSSFDRGKWTKEHVSSL